MARDIRSLQRAQANVANSQANRVASGPVYLRTDLVYGLESGGSVGHIAGVLNNLGEASGTAPILLTTDRIPTVSPDIEAHVVEPDGRFRDFPEVPELAFSRRFAAETRRLLGRSKPAFVYQRYSTSNYAGVLLAKGWGVPFVLEYNGSEIWINRHWGRPLKYEALAEEIELLNLRSADLVVVVSRPMLDELVARGLDPSRILVNPNGVDPERYTPATDGSLVRARLGLDDRLVIGFIGTFGPWHGAEVLAEAFCRMIAAEPKLRERVRLLLIGDGSRLGATREVLDAAAVTDLVAFAGRTRQEDGPAHLAACDILVSPHVPNPDGSPFFGSPTKLFEYMAMGRPVVASRLDQIGEVLEDDVTGVLVPPGDAGALASAMRALLDDPDRRIRLADAARQQAVARHTWREHTRRIVERLHAGYA